MATTHTWARLLSARVVLQPRLGPDAPAATRFTGFLVLYLLSVVAGRLTTDPHTGIALVWPAAGVAFAWYLCAGAARSPRRSDRALWVTAAITLGTAVLNVTSGMPWDKALVFAFGNALSGWVAAAWYLRRVETRHLFLTRRGQVMPLIIAAVLGAVGNAVVGPLYSMLVAQAPVSVLGEALARTGISIVVVGALLMRMLSPPPRIAPPGVSTHVGLVVGAAATYGVVMLWLPDQQVTFFLTSMTVIVAMLLNIDGLVTYVFGAGVVVVLTSLLDIGTFAGGAPVEAVVPQVFVAQGFVMVQAVLGMLLCLGREDQTGLISALRTARREAETQSELIRHVVGGMPDAVVAVDGDEVTIRNRAAFDWFALEPGETAVGTVLMHGGRDGTGPLDRALRGETVAEDLVVEDETGDGDARVLSIRAHRLEGDDDQAVVVAREVTEHRRWVAELSSFASVLAHDLLNPVGAAEGWVEVLEEELEEDASPIVVSSVGRIGSSVGRIREIVSGLHAYSVARGGELSFVEIDLQDLALRLADGRMTASTAARGGAVPAITVEAHQRVTADRSLLAQVLDNLLGNSLKYTAPGSLPQIHVTASPPVDGFVTVRVDDAGIGIPPGDRAKVFEEFHRVSGHARSYVGTGLGLSICRRMIERHGGTIRADESPLGGTRIEFTVPAAETVEEPGAPELSQGHPGQTVDAGSDRLTEQITEQADNARHISRATSRREARAAALPGEPARRGR